MVGEIARWVFYSPRRLFVTLAGAVVAVALVATVLATDRSDPPRATSHVQASAEIAGLPAIDPYVDTAVAFTNAWARRGPDETTDDWISRLKPYATSELVDALRTTDPANLPDTKVNGEPRARFVSDSSALLAVPLADGETVAVTVIADSGRWQVTDIQPDTGDAGDAS